MAAHKRLPDGCRAFLVGGRPFVLRDDGEARRYSASGWVHGDAHEAEGALPNSDCARIASIFNPPECHGFWHPVASLGTYAAARLMAGS